MAEGDDAAQVAATINEAREAFAAGDGAELCPLLTDEGRELMLRLGEQSQPPLDAETCEEVVEGLAELPAFRRDPPPTEPAYEASDVDLDSADTGFSGIDTVPEGGPSYVEVPCDPDRGAAGSFYATETPAGWRLSFPGCLGQ